MNAAEAASDREMVRQRMFETEALQLYLQTPSLQKITQDADPHADQLERPTLREFVHRLR